MNRLFVIILFFALALLLYGQTFFLEELTSNCMERSMRNQHRY